MTSFCAGLLALGLILSPIKSAGVDATSQSASASLSLTSEDAAQGGSLTINLVADGLNNISAFSCEVFYPVSVVETSAVFPTVNESIALYDIKKNEAGVVSFSFLSPASDGISFADGTSLLSITVGIKSDAPAGSARFWCATGEVYDSSKKAVALNSPSCYSTIAEKQTPAQEARIDFSCNKDNYVKGEDALFNLSFVNSLRLSALRVVFTFDGSIFDFVSFAPKNDLGSAQTNLNTQQNGVVAWAFLSPGGIDCSSQFATLTLKIKSGKETTSTVNVSISQVYGADKTQYAGSSRSTQATIVKTKPKIRLKNLNIQSDTMSMDCIIDAESEMACGDFTITYPVDSLVVSSVTTPAPAKVFFSQGKDDGKFNFSYLDTKDLVDETTLLTISFKKKVFFADLEGTIGIKNRYDSYGEPRNSNHDYLDIGFEPCQYSFPFNFESISYNVSWDSETRTVTDDYFSLYMNEGESIYNIKINGISVESIHNELTELAENDGVYTAISPCAFVANFFQNEFYFGYCGWEDTIRSMRAEEFSKKLDRLTTNVAICDGNGFLPEKKSEMLNLLKEYRKFVDEIKNVLSKSFLSDGTSVPERIAVLERGETRATLGSLLPRKPESERTQSLSETSSVVFVALSIVTVLGFAFYHRRKRFN